jgi:enoyl-CoA hydratase/carnithine racemase
VLYHCTCTCIYPSNDDIKVVVTIGEGKFYSNGLDLDGMARYTAEDFRQLASNVKKLTERILTFPMVTIAAINGMCLCCFVNNLA